MSKNDEHMKKLESEEDDHDHNHQKQQNEKKQSSSAINELVVHFNVSPNISQINQSYSSIDYCPMMSDGVLGNVNNEKLSTSHKSLFDCYLNPSENIETKSDTSYMQTTVIQSLVVKLPVKIIQKDIEKTTDK
ncbi:unnamed protein product [Rotaria sordida]|uniref:Uncharacterized protein n=1 Tax=Rotaria sordida TaxID=392033 RepID=A0A814F925_9BILA|nr:unnamed protein product [Rotaria sordida]CAF3689398.1 unnamed protein product [Rotaria sordida]